MLLGLAFTLVAGFLVGSWIDEVLWDGYTESWIGAGAVWLIGLIVSIRQARKVWKKRSVTSSRPDRLPEE